MIAFRAWGEGYVYRHMPRGRGLANFLIHEGKEQAVASLVVEVTTQNSSMTRLARVISF
jgi:hypothetical protein